VTVTASVRAAVTVTVLYLWPGNGWVPGRIRRVRRRNGFSHVVGCAASSPLGALDLRLELMV
jgi:hypothetical protein